MRNSMFVATIAFFVVYFGGKYLWLQMFQSSADGSLSALSAAVQNNILWTAFMVYLIMRGLLQAVALKRSVYSQAG